MSTITKAKEQIKNGIRGYLLKDEKGQYIMNEVNRLPFYLEGNPGIGKTQIVSQIANELGIGYVSFSITHHSRNTVLGLPVIQNIGDVKYTEYTMSEIIAKVLEEYKNGAKEGILLLDEFNCMSDTILPVMLSFLQTKNIGMHKLPEGWVIVLCGNPVKSNRSARKFDMAILDRVRKVEIQYSKEDFLQYATDRDFEDEIISFVKLNSDMAYVCNPEGDGELVTARSWENLDITLKMYKKMAANIDEETIAQFIKAPQVSREFFRHYQLANSARFTYEDCEEILNGKQHDKYSRRLSDMSIDVQWDVVDTLVKSIHRKIENKDVNLARSVKMVDNLLKLIERVNDNVLVEKVFSTINADRTILGALGKCKSDEYDTLCKKIFYATQKVV